MKGNHYKMQQKCQRDEKTRVEVVRLTDNKANYDRPYFTATQFTGDGKYTIFVSDFTGTSKISNPDAPAIGKIGFGELFLLDLEKGEVLQLTEGEAIKMGHGAHAVIQPDGKKAFYYSNACLKEVNLETLESKTLMDIPFSYNFHSLGVTNDGRYLLFSLVEEVPLITTVFADPLSEAAPGARERFFKEPSSLIIRYDLKTESGYAVYGGHHRITHASMMPDNGDKIIFCHDGPWQLVQRMWTVQADTDEIQMLIPQKRYLERIGHEFFTPGGRVGAQYSYRYRPDMEFFQNADIFVDFDGKREERYYYSFGRPGHISVAGDESMGVGDTAMINRDMKDAKRYLSLIHYTKEDHKANLALLCAHDTSGKKSAHVHPVYTPDGKHIIFSSDKEGYLNIYMVEADWKKAIKEEVR